MECSRTPSYADQPLATTAVPTYFGPMTSYPNTIKPRIIYPKSLGLSIIWHSTIWDAKVRPALWPNIT